MKKIIHLMLLLAGWGCWGSLHAQAYTPIPIGGFNNDVVADTGTDASAVTTCVLDLSNYVLYSAAFAARNNISAGMLNSGTIVSGNRTYQLGDYGSYNALYLSAGGSISTTTATGLLTLGSPGLFSRLSLLVFSTEGNSTLSIVLKYTDGTIVSGGTYPVTDWFYGNNAVYSSCGRIARATTGPYAPDGLPNNPRFYPLDIPVACANQSKLLESVFVSFSSGSGASTRGVVLALSGVPYTPVFVTSAISGETCGASNGSIQLTVTGGTSPLTYTWNTTPAQTTPTASNLPGGNYTCTITDSNNCVTSWKGTVTRTSPVTLTASSSVPAVCKGDYVTLTATPSGGTATNYTWSPGAMYGATVSTSPADTTTYTVNATDAFGCAVSATVAVAVKPLPVASFVVNPTSVCLPAEQTVQFTGAAGYLATYNWNFAGANVKRGSGAGPYTIVFDLAGDYTLQLQVTDNGCVSATSVQNVKVSAPFAAPVITATAVTNNSITFSWLPVAGAIGYQVNINGVPISNTITSTTYTATGLQPLQTVIIEVTALGAVTCQNSTGKGVGKTLTGQYFIPNSFTPNGDGLNDVFKVYGNIVAGVQMKIFNQWGELLYEGSGLDKGWDGTQKGTLQPVGVYAYVIRLSLTDGTVLIKKGFIHLIH